MNSYPSARRGDDADDVHGTRIADPYRWLETETAETAQWLAAQDDVWRAVRDQCRAASWEARVSRFLDVNYESVPIWRGGTRFVMSHEKGTGKPRLLAAEAGRAPVDVLSRLPKALTSNGALTTWRPSREGQYVACCIASGGSEDSSLCIVDARTGAVVDGPVPGCGGASIQWLPGGKQLLVSRLGHLDADGSPAPEPGWGRHVFLHRLGDDFTSDRVIFSDESHGRLFSSISLSADGRALVISRSDGSPASGNELLFGELTDGDVRFECMKPRDGSLSGVSFAADGRIFILTNSGAPNWRVVEADASNAWWQDWNDVVPEDKDATISDFIIAAGTDGDHEEVMAVSRARWGVGEIALYSLTRAGERTEAGLVGDVALPGLGTVGPLIADAHDKRALWFSYEDPVTPPTAMRYEFGGAQASGGQAAPRLKDIVTRRLSCVSADGTVIPMTAGRPLTARGPIPTILCVYGGFGTSYPPAYSPALCAWLDAGGSFVIAHVRGGGEGGARWHEAGTRHSKQRSIDDLLACAGYLCEAGWTAPNLLSAWGVSNGGLIAAAAVTQRPELFAAAACSSPLCDMIRRERLERFSSWNSEFGSVHDQHDFPHLLAYSPYHNVNQGIAYPGIIFTVSDDDQRVSPAHARKMCAAVQHATAGDRPVVLRREANVGHVGRSVTRTARLNGDILAFLGSYSGLSETGESS